ncbi:MAG: hypothetical protein ABSD56_11740 [Bryobacteraceae bacterium]
MLLAALALALPVWAGLDAVKAEPNLEKRAGMALANAGAALTSARDSYVAGDLQRTTAALDEVRQSVELAYSSLLETHKNPRKKPMPFKRAEIRTRELLRRLDDFREQMSYEDRGVLDEVRAAVRKIREDLLRGLLGEKSK